MGLHLLCVSWHSGGTLAPGPCECTERPIVHRSNAVALPVHFPSTNLAADISALGGQPPPQKAIATAVSALIARSLPPSPQPARMLHAMRDRLGLGAWFCNRGAGMCLDVDVMPLALPSNPARAANYSSVPDGRVRHHAGEERGPAAGEP